MSSPRIRRSIFSTPVAISFRFSTTGCNTCLRLKAKSCRVRATARSPAFLASRSSSLARSSSGSLAMANSVQHMITESRLLKSCAMPPARLPMASSFCDTRSCCSRLSRSVTSTCSAWRHTRWPLASLISRADTNTTNRLPSRLMTVISLGSITPLSERMRNTSLRSSGLA